MSSYYEKFLATREVKCIDEEIPFEIPATWEWCRLLSIVSLLGDGIHGTPEYSEGGSVYFINGNNLFDGQILIKPDTKTVSKEEAVKHSRLLNESTVLVSINGTIGNIAFYSGENVILGKSACYFNLLNGIERKYIKIVLQTDYFLEYTKRVATGSTIKNVPLSGMRNVLIPIPPKDEQQVIIDKLSSLKLLIEKFNIEQSQLNKLNAELRSVLKKSILQEAIQGKLLPQITEEGTAQELLEQIRQEKQRLVKEGKLKKSALLDSIIYKGDDNKYFEKNGNTEMNITDEIPFEIPDSWSWVRLNDICSYIQRGKSPKYSLIKKYPVVAQKCNQWSGFSIDKAQFIDPDTLSSYGEERILQDGDLMWNSTGLGTLGRMAIYCSTLNPYELAVTDSHVTVIRAMKKFVLPQYLYYYFTSNTVQSVIEDKSDGSTKQKELATATVKTYLVPIPPLMEQSRIISKIEQLASIMSR